jgi:hypothetical protein
MSAVFKSITSILAAAILTACTATPLTPVIPTAAATIAPAAASNPTATTAPRNLCRGSHFLAGSGYTSRASGGDS